jgi:hypothetical protein
VLKDLHVAYQALHYSYQARYDYWLSTNSPLYTDQLVILADASLKKMYEKIAGASLFTSLTDGSAFALLTGEQVKVRRGVSGLEFRPLGERFLFLNSLNTTMPQALNRKDKNDTILPGLLIHSHDSFGLTHLTRRMETNSGAHDTTQDRLLQPATWHLLHELRLSICASVRTLGYLLMTLFFPSRLMDSVMARKSFTV